MQSQSDSAQTSLSQGGECNVPKWPKMELSAEFKEDIRKAFTLFDVTGEGTVTVDAVQVAFRALGYDTEVNEFKELRRQTKEFGERVDFGEFLNLLTDRMLSLDSDMDITKSFELMDAEKTGYIDLDDLRRASEILELPEMYDDDFSAMLLGAQICDPAEELRQAYEERQKQERIRNGLSYGIDSSAAEAMAAAAASGAAMPMHELPGFQRARRLSSSGQPSPDSLIVTLKQFERLMKMVRPPVEDITLM